mgnify:CR=1 FL=1
MKKSRVSFRIIVALVIDIGVTLVLAASTIIVKLCGVHGTSVQERSETW